MKLRNGRIGTNANYTAPAAAPANRQKDGPGALCVDEVGIGGGFVV